MKMVYLINRRFPTERGHGAQIAQSIDAFRLNGIEVEVFGVKKKQTSLGSQIQNIQDFYKLSEPIDIHCFITVPEIKIPFLESVISWINQILFVIQTLIRSRQTDVLYTRDETVALILSLIRKSVFLELHYELSKTTWLFSRFNSHLSGLIINNHQSFLEYLSTFPQVPMIEEPNAIHESWLELRPKKKNGNKILIGYAGSIYAWKGIDTLLDSLEYLPPKYSVLIIGGSREEHQIVKNKYRDFVDRITLISHKSLDTLQKNLAECDMLVVPFTGKESHSNNYTSPLKIYEYLATGIPVVASDIPSIRNLVTEKNVTFFTPDSPKDLASKIVSLPLKNSKKNRSFVKDKTWYNRAKRIKKFIESK